MKLPGSELRWNRMELEQDSKGGGARSAFVGLEIFDIEFKIGKDRLLRVYIDRLPGPENPHDPGVTHKDCENVSVQLSAFWTSKIWSRARHYMLEVSSPGLDRKLLKPADYQRFVGRLAKIWLNEPVASNRITKDGWPVIPMAA